MENFHLLSQLWIRIQVKQLVQSKVNKYHVISWNHCMKAGYSSTLFATNQPEVTELHRRTTG